MRRKELDPQTDKENFINVYWGDHYPSCEKCREVDLEKSATFANACAEGSPLLAEEMIKRQRHLQQEKERAVRAWAKKAGVFKDA